MRRESSIRRLFFFSLGNRTFAETYDTFENTIKEAELIFILLGSHSELYILDVSCIFLY